MSSHRLTPQVAPCFVTHNLALGGAQTAVLRYITALPEWVRDRTTLYCQSEDMPLLDVAEKNGFSCGDVTREAPQDPSSWILSYGNLMGLPKRPTSLLLHSWDDAGWRYINRAYPDERGMQIAGVSQRVLNRYKDWIARGQHEVAGVLPPPVSEFTMAAGKPDAGGRIVVAWMGRPLETKGLMTLPWLLKQDPRIVIRAWTGAETAGLEYTRRTQTEAMEQLYALANKLGVADRLDIRPLDFNPFNYKHRLEGAHVLLGNSKAEGFLLTAAEALSCGIPVVVTKTCGVAEFIRPGHNGYLIDWNDRPKKLAADACKAIHKAVKLNPVDCLSSVADLSVAANFGNAYSHVLGMLTGSNLEHADARVTVGVRIHEGTDLEKLDDAINSIATQTYKRFKTILLVDGPWSFAEPIAARYGLPLICTGKKADIENCSWLHRQGVERCGTEFYKPLDYDDQILPTYLERAVAMMDSKKLDVYGCKLMTLENNQITPRLHWPNKGMETMFTGNSDDNMLPHSSVLMRTSLAIKAGNYQERAVGLGADDYHLWYRIHLAGGKFHRDDEVRNVVYRIHENNSLNIRRERFGGSNRKKITVIGAGAAAASIALMAPTQMAAAEDQKDDAKPQDGKAIPGQNQNDRNDPPHS